MSKSKFSPKLEGTENFGSIGNGDTRQIKEKKVPFRSDFGKRLHRFRVLTPRSFILRGSRAMNDRRFTVKSRGRQAAPCSIIAIVYGRLFELKEWMRDHVDQVLEYGDKLFHISLTRSQLKDEEYMKTNLVHNEFYIGFYKVLVSIEDSGIHGNLFSKSIGSDLAEGLRKFLKSNDSGVITVQGTSVAVWRQSDDDGFFYYDPASCDETGLRYPDGTACLMRFKNMNDLHDHLLKNLNWRYDSRYCIDKVTVLRVTKVGRGFVGRLDVIGPPIVRKSVLRSINHVDIDDHKVDCTKPLPKEETLQTLARIEKEPLFITISNYSIDRSFATQLLVNRNDFDTGYSYDDMRVNVPSTFKELPGKIAILHGLTHEESDMYKGKGEQNVANCVMAIAMKKVHPVKTWMISKLDEILRLGDLLYANVKFNKPTIKMMTAADLNNTKIQIEDRKLIVDVDLITVTGTINSKVPPVLNLKQAMEEFFLLNEEGVIETTSMAMAVWSQDSCYYLFNPRSCDAAGIRIREEKTVKIAKRDKEEEFEQNDEKEVGNCCVIRFPDVNSLVALFLKNVDPTKKNDRFIIRHITIMDDVPGTRAWNDFQPGIAGKTWVLRGRISNMDESFEENQGLQSLAMSVVALVNAKETPAAKWNSETIDEVIREGDTYYNWCKPAEMEEKRLFLVRDLKKNLYFKNRKVTIDIEEATVVGDLLASDDSKALTLEEGLRQFFEIKRYGVIETKKLSAAVWKEEEEIKNKDKKEETFYYYFDPNPRDKLGQLSTERNEENSACLVRSSNLSALTDLIKNNAGKDVEGGDDFMIHELKNVFIGALMTNEEIEADKQIPIMPNLNNYSNLGNTGALLLGTIDQKNEMTFKRPTRDKQQAANSLTTLAMTKLYDPFLWYRELVDDILRIGDKFTNKNLMNLPEVETEEELPRNYLLPSEITEDFAIGVNRMLIDLEEESITGRMTDVTRLLEQFFEKNAMGVFRQGDVMMPIWKEGEVFFTMDPRGRDVQGEPRDGTAAVMWFTDIPSLAGVLRAVAREVDDFVIDAVSIENVYETRVTEAERVKKTTSGEDLWHHFPKLDNGVWHIDGNITMTHEMLNKANHGKQSAAIAAMAIVFSKVYQPRQWTSSVLDEIIITGDKLHSKCVERLGNDSIPLINEIISEFFLSSRRIVLTIKDCVEAGSLAGKPPKIQNLQNGIDSFFNKYEAGVLTVRGNLNLAIWKVDNAYYTLIPDWSTTTEENRESPNTVSTIPRVIRFKDTRLLVEYLLCHLGSEGDYQITAIDVQDWDKPLPWELDPSPAIRRANLPPFNAYRKLRGEARAILRGSYHQGDKIFPETLRGRQTAANCVVALGMSVVKSPVTWTKKTMDEILAIGSSVHQETRRNVSTELRPKPKDIIRIFHIGVNILTVDVESNTVTGLIIPFVSEDNKKDQEEAKERTDKDKKRATRREQSLSSPILLEEGLQKFFHDNRAGILVTDRGMIAIWKDLGVYFMYDPRAKSDQGLPDSRGTSCVMWFACMKPLYDIILANIDSHERRGTFEICRVIVKNVMLEALPCPDGFQPYLDRTIPITYPIILERTVMLNVEPLSRYKIVDEELSVLHGSLHMNHRAFSLRNRGLQSTAIAAVAVVVGLLHVPSTWTSELIDAVVRYGDSLYSESARVARSGVRNLSPSELLTVFIVGDSKVSIHIHEHTTAGILDVFDLYEALTMFFRANCAGILHTTNLAVAVMQYYGKFYMFDPCSRNDRGRPTYDGAACMFKCNSIVKMAKIFVANCNLKRPNIYTLNAVNVLSLHFFSITRNVSPSKHQH
ncbi:uncharacterized protein LOC105835727 [Monomorium pharaonis]|uniref:uncharacterized protein LOC105835727 n=1 Tax=Monomorium pharaonis TaxID=307658 RepID=UPI00102E1F7B|nr:uncharacterized protein LOC105835727 [Monomorium pharaonis]